MDYSFKDLKQSMIGTFDTILFFFVLRAGDKMPFLSARIGFIISIVWLYIIYQSFNGIRRGKEHFAINVVVTYILCAFMTVIFQLATLEEILANPFGSPAMLALWMALPIALIFDRENISNVLRRYYVREKKR